MLFIRSKLCLNVKRDNQHIPISAHFLYSSCKTSKTIYPVTCEETSALPDFVIAGHTTEKVHVAASQKSMYICMCIYIHTHACMHQPRYILQIQNNGASASHCGLYSIKNFHLWRQLLPKVKLLFCYLYILGARARSNMVT